MSRLEELKRQRKIIDAQIRELQNNETTVRTARYTQSRYGECFHEIRVECKGRSTNLHVKGMVYKWLRVVCEKDKGEMISRLRVVIADLSELLTVLEGQA